jgi:hypothetical protein
MTPFDDNDLIDQLQAGIAERQSGISAPDGIGDNARRAARKRTATRAVGAGVPVLAAAGVATVLATSSGPGSTTARGPSAGSSALSAPTGPVKAENTAYIVKRVRAKIAADSQSNTVVHTQLYASGDVISNGSLLIHGPEKAEGWEYLPPDRTFYQRNVGINADGSPTGITETVVIGPVVNGKSDVTFAAINSTNHTYSQTQTEYPVDANAPASRPPTVGLQSSPAEVQQELQSGQVTQEGTTTVNGTQAIALSVAMPSGEPVDYTLYVDAQTYQPLRTVTDGTSADNSTAYVTDWIPATPDNIAKAKDDSIPAGYTKVDHLVDPLAG